MFNVLCEECQERQATVFVTKIVNHKTSKQQLCETCARKRASGEGWMQHLTGVLGGPLALEEALNRTLDDGPLDDIVMSLLDDEPAGGPQVPASERTDVPTILESPFGLDTGEFDDDLFHDDMEEAAADFESEVPPLIAAAFAEGGAGHESKTDRIVPEGRCQKCGTTWDRLRQDGRAGCWRCYSFFTSQLTEVMARVQKSAEHVGKAPRAATKRHRRLEHLRARRDHRLSLLDKRLKQAVAASRYEDAAKLRDKIKLVTSTIVSDEA